MEYGDITVQDEAVILPLTFMGSFTRDLTVADGTQGITGIGFRPSYVHFIAGINVNAAVSFGFDNGVTGQLMANYHNNTANTFTRNSTRSIRAVVSNPDDYDGFISSMDIDGFTITWDRVNAPSGSLVTLFMAVK